MRNFILFLVSIFLFASIPAVAGEDVEKMKLEVEKLKLENENLRLKAQNSQTPKSAKLDECLSKSILQSCFDYYGDETEAKSPSYVSNVKEIEKLQKKNCKTNKEEACSLVSKIMYDINKDKASIPIMETYCSSLKSEMSSRCVDLVQYYLGIGMIENHNPDIVKAEHFGRMCESSKDPLRCGQLGMAFLSAEQISVKDARRIGIPLLKKYLLAKDLDDGARSAAGAILGCKVDVVVEKPTVSAISTSHITTWIRYKNLGKLPIQFHGELKANLTGDDTKVFLSEFVGKTLNFSRFLNAGELIREDATFSVDDNLAPKFISNFKIVRLSIQQGKIQNYNFEKSFDRMCDIAVKIE